jgi:hypothetical protein
MASYPKTCETNIQDLVKLRDNLPGEDPFPNIVDTNSLSIILPKFSLMIACIFVISHF